MVLLVSDGAGLTRIPKVRKAGTLNTQSRATYVRAMDHTDSVQSTGPRYGFVPFLGCYP